MSELSRLSGVFFEPSKTFADIAERPKWFVPLLIVIIAAVAFYAVVGSHVGWRGYIQEQMSTPRAARQMEQMSPAQRAQTLAIYDKVYPILFTAGPIVGLPLAYMFTSLLVFAVASGIMSAGVRYKQVFAITCYAMLTTLVTRALAFLVMFLKTPDQFNIMNPVALNPAAFMNQATSSKFLYTLGTGFDLIAFWGMILVATGIKAAAGKKLTFGGALFAVFLPWAVLLFLGASLAGMFS